MELALIPPISLLGYTQWSTYQLMLPQLTKSPAYASIYSHLCQDPKQFVILDNGAAENYRGRSTDLVRMALSYGVDEVVIPDELRDGEATVMLAKEFLKTFRRTTGLRRMFVCQGRELKTFVRTAIWAAEQGIDTIGIPRHAIETCNDKMARVHIANEIQEKGCRAKIHFLGASPLWCSELRFLADPRVVNQNRIRGMDTSMPFNFAHRGFIMGMDAPTIERPDSYFTLGKHNFDLHVLDMNLKLMEEWRR